VLFNAQVDKKRTKSHNCSREDGVKIFCKTINRDIIFRLIFEDRINEIYTKIFDYKITTIMNHRSGYPVNLNLNKIRP